jgi:hypothetical protein
MNEKDKLDAALDRIFAYGPSKKDDAKKHKKTGTTEAKKPAKKRAK